MNVENQKWARALLGGVTDFLTAIGGYNSERLGRLTDLFMETSEVGGLVNLLGSMGLDAINRSLEYRLAEEAAAYDELNTAQLEFETAANRHLAGGEWPELEKARAGLEKARMGVCVAQNNPVSDVGHRWARLLLQETHDGIFNFVSRGGNDLSTLDTALNVLGKATAWATTNGTKK